MQQTRLAKKAGLDAIVCSPYEVKDVRKILKEIITPGVQIGKKIMTKNVQWKQKK